MPSPSAPPSPPAAPAPPATRARRIRSARARGPSPAGEGGRGDGGKGRDCSMSAGRRQCPCRSIAQRPSLASSHQHCAMTLHTYCEGSPQATLPQTQTQSQPPTQIQPLRLTHICRPMLVHHAPLRLSHPAPRPAPRPECGPLQAAAAPHSFNMPPTTCPALPPCPVSLQQLHPRPLPLAPP